MTVSFTSNGIAGRLLGTYGYSIVHAPSSGGSTFKVNMTQKGTGAGNASETAWITTDGSVLAVYALGQNHTGADAKSLFEVYMGPFQDEVSATNIVGAYLASPAVQELNQTTVHLGPTTMTVNRYQSSAIFTITECGTQATVSTFSLEMGTLPGTNFVVITNWTIQETVGGQQNSLTFAATSLTPT